MIIRPIQPAAVSGQPKSVPGRGAAIADIWIKDRWNDWNLDVKQALFDMEKEQATDKAKRDFISNQLKALYDERQKLQELDARDTNNWRDNMTSLERQRIQSTTQARIATMEERGRMTRSQLELEARERIDGAKAIDRATKDVDKLKPAEAYIPAMKSALGSSTQSGGQLNALMNYTGVGPSGDVLLRETGIPLLQESLISYEKKAYAEINSNTEKYGSLTEDQKLDLARGFALDDMRSDLDSTNPKQIELFNQFASTADPEIAGSAKLNTKAAVTAAKPRQPFTGGVSAPVVDKEDRPTGRSLTEINQEIARLQNQYADIPELASRSIRERARGTFGTEILGKTPAQARQAELIQRLQSMSPEQINNILGRQEFRTALGEDLQFTPEQLQEAEDFELKKQLEIDADKEMPALSVEEAQQIARDTDKTPSAFESGQGKTLAEMARKRLTGMTDEEKAQADAAFFAQQEAQEAERASVRPRVAPRAAPQSTAQPAAQTDAEKFVLNNLEMIKRGLANEVDFSDMPSSLPPIEPLERQSAEPTSSLPPIEPVERQAPVDAQKTVAGDVYARFATEYDSPVQTAKRTVQQLAGQKVEPRPGTQRKSESTPTVIEAYKRVAVKPDPTREDVAPILKDTTQDKKIKDTQLLGLALGKAKTVISKNDPKEIKQYFITKEAKQVLDLFNKYLEKGGGDIKDDEKAAIYKDTVLSKPPGDEYWNALIAFAILAEAKSVGWDMKILQEQSDL